MATRFRGMQCAPFATPADIEDLLAIKANVIRYQMTAGPNDFLNASAEEYRAWVLSNLEHLDDHILPILNGRAKIIIDLHTPPYGMTGSWHNIFVNRLDGQELVKNIWIEIAMRYGNNSDIYGFDILNEPAGSNRQVKAFMTNVVAAIRRFDTSRKLLVSCPRSIPSNFLKTAYQRGDPNCQYVLHMYSPLRFTHQGVMDYMRGDIYPTVKYNKAWLLKTLKPVIDFQKQNKARIIMNEFSVSSFADDASRRAYLKDVISIAETYGWQWCYHAWREHPVWSAENCAPVFSMLKRYFRKNRG